VILTEAGMTIQYLAPSKAKSMCQGGPLLAQLIFAVMQEQMSLFSKDVMLQLVVGFGNER